MIGETQPEMKLLEVVVVIYPLFAKSRQFNTICIQNLVLQHIIARFYVQFLMFLLKNLGVRRKFTVWISTDQNESVIAWSWIDFAVTLD